MALIYPSGIYREGQVEFDAMPYIKAIEAKKRARDEAFTKYYDNLKTQINTAGVRQQDLLDPVTGGGITKDIENWTRYGIENRKDIAKGGMAKLEFEKKQREILNRIQQSKGVTKFELELGKAKFDGKYDPDDDDMNVQQSVGFSIYDTKHYKEDGTPYGWGDVSPAIGTLTPAEKDKLYDYGLSGAKLQRDLSVKPTTQGNQYVFTTKYSNDALIKGAISVAEMVPKKPLTVEEKKYRKTYVRLLDDANFMAQAGPIFKSYFNKSIETPQDAAAAEFLMKKSALTGTEYSKIVAPRARVSRSSGSGNKSIDESLYYLSDEVATNQGKLLDIVDSKGKSLGKKYVIPVRDVDPERLNIILGTDIQKGIKGPDPIKFSWPKGDGTTETIEVYYADPNTMDWEGAYGQKISREGAKDRYIRVAAPTKQKYKLGTKGAESKEKSKDNPLGI